MTFIQSTFFSQVLGMHVSCDVLLPAKPAGSDGYRVLWLFHPALCDRSDWTHRTDVVRFAEAANLAVIMPDAHDSAYADMVYGLNYGTYLTEELPPLLRSFFPLSARREDQFLLGCSMGAEGAMKIAFEHPELFAAVGCLSAGIRNRSQALEDDPRWHNRMNLAYGFDRSRWPEEKTFDNVRQLARSGAPCPRVYHACGQDDFLLSSAHETRDLFLSFPDNPFDYIYEEPAGNHNWKFWNEHLKRFIDFAFKN